MIITTTLTKRKQLTFPWVPKIGPKIKKETQKFGFRVAFQTAPKVKNIYAKTKISQYHIATLECTN